MTVSNASLGPSAACVCQGQSSSVRSLRGASLVAINTLYLIDVEVIISDMPSFLQSSGLFSSYPRLTMEEESELVRCCALCRCVDYSAASMAFMMSWVDNVAPPYHTRCSTQRELYR